MTKSHLRLLVPGILGAAALAMTVGCATTMTTQSTQQTDSAITSSVENSLQNSEKVKARQVEVQTREGVVYLTGVVDTEEARREAGRLSWRTADVSGVVNDLTVGERTVGSWVDDVRISSQVKAKLIANSEIRARDIDVSSSQSVVTLIGRVSSAQIKSDAERVARNTKGVKDVNNELEVGRLRR